VDLKEAICKITQPRTESEESIREGELLFYGCSHKPEDMIILGNSKADQRRSLRKSIFHKTQ
jgi:hypothetical protein